MGERRNEYISKTDKILLSYIRAYSNHKPIITNKATLKPTKTVKVKVEKSKLLDTQIVTQKVKNSIKKQRSTLKIRN